MPGRVTLDAVAGPLQGRSFSFDAHDTFLFGRSPDCHARLAADDATASRHHFLLEVNPPQARLRDLGSLNGTYVNGTRHGGRERHETPEQAAQRVLAQVDLRDGDQIRVGASVFSVGLRGPAACFECGREVSEQERAGQEWVAGTYLCTDCRERSKRRARAGRPPGAERASALEGLLETPVPDEDAPDAVPGYELGPLLGRGGMGAVFLGQRLADGARVALKVLRAQVVVDRVARESFHREIEVTKSLRHPRIVALLDHGSAGDRFYFAMEYCAGGSLGLLLERRGRPLGIGQGVDLVLQALDGLAFAHQAGFIHRDIKPENLLLADVAGSVAKLTDFGLAKSFQDAGFSGFTATGTVGGTYAFMPREQLTNFRQARPSSDVWSMAAALYYLLTLEFPRDFGSERDPLQVILHGGTVPIRKRRPAIPEGLADVVGRALADDPAERYPTAAEFRDGLREAAHGIA